jgi:hypothetical protein
MTNQWWRAWHGLTTDEKWAAVGAEAGVATGIALVIGVKLLERASQAEDRGDIHGYNAKAMACSLGCCTATEVERVVEAMRGIGMLVGDRFTAWEKRQPKREDEGVADRVRQHRERQRRRQEEAPVGLTLALAPLAPATAVPAETPCNAVKRTVTTESEEIRSDQSVSPEPVPRAPAREAADRPTDEFLISKLTEAIGAKAAPGLLTVGGIRPLRELIDRGGYDFELDVLPEVRGFACRLRDGPWRKFSPRTDLFDKIRDRRRLRLANEAKARGQPAQVFVAFDSPQWRAWLAHEGKPRPAQDCAVGGRRRKGWYFPSEWPPDNRRLAGS